jgi:nephrocystin-3
MSSDVNPTGAVRIFISSTFLDMQAERDCLVNLFFPSLRQRFRASGLELVDVDLRWGITDVQADLGETIGICLSEIDRSRPFFIGLLGERYGWVPTPEFLHERIRQTFPILEDLAGRSATEIEFEYGALRNPSAAPNAIFLIRNPPRPGTPEHAALAPYAETAEDRRLKLAALKDRIRGCGLKFATYDSAEELPGLIEDLLVQPLSAIAADREAARPSNEIDDLHDAYAHERRRNYQGAPNRLAALDAWAGGGANPLLLIEGEPGAGKSALIANWVAHHMREAPNDLTLSHYIGSSSESATPDAILRRLIRLISTALGDPVEAPADGPALMRAFVSELERAGRRLSANSGRLIIALDGLDKLAAWPDLRWIPNPPPPGVMLVGAALNGRARDEFLSRGAVQHHVAPLASDEGRSLVRSRLGQFAKTLPEDQLDRIIAHALAQSPLFLQTLTNELRVFGRHEALAAQITRYLESASVPELFDRVLASLEQACGKELSSLVTRLICLSRAGLEQTALLKITGAAPIRLAAILLRLGDGLWEHKGRLNFAHDFLRQAVMRRYLSGAAEVSETHRLLARHFALAPEQHEDWAAYLDVSGPSWVSVEHRRTPAERAQRVTDGYRRLEASGLRRQHEHDRSAYLILDEETPMPPGLGRHVEEGPYQLLMAGDLGRLRQVLTDLRWFPALATRGQAELVRYWSAIAPHEAEAERLLCEAAAIQLPPHGKWTKRQWRLVWEVIDFLRQAGWAGRPCLALMRQHTELAVALRGNMHPSAFDAQRDLAALESALGEHERARERLRDAVEGHCETLGPEHPHTLETKLSLAIALSQSGQELESTALLEAIIPGLVQAFGEDHDNALSAQAALATTYHEVGDVARAQALRREILPRFEQILGPDHPRTLDLLYETAIGMRVLGDHDAASKLHASVMERRRSVLGPEHPATLNSMSAYGVALMHAQRFEEAEAYLAEAIRIAASRRSLRKTSWLARRNLADLYLMSGAIDKTMATESALIADLESAGELSSDLAIETLQSHATGLRALGQPGEALAILERALTARPLDSWAINDSARRTQIMAAELLAEMGELPRAKILLAQLLDTWRSARAPVCAAMLETLRLHMAVESMLGQFDDAIKLGELIPTLAAPELVEGVVGCETQMAGAFMACKRWKNALAHFERIFSLCMQNKLAAPFDVIASFAEACHADGQTGRGLEAEAVVLAQWKQTPDAPRQAKLESLMKIGALSRRRFKRKDFAGAEDAQRAILDSETRLFGADSPQVRQTQSNLEAIAAGRRAPR